MSDISSTGISAYTIMLAQAASVPALFALEKAVFGADSHGSIYPDFFFRQAIALWPQSIWYAQDIQTATSVATPVAKLLGYILTTPAEEVGIQWILSVATHPEARGRGVGRALVERALQTAQQQGARAVRLTVHPDNPAKRLYSKLGFVEIGFDPAYFGAGEPRVVMECKMVA